MDFAYAGSSPGSASSVEVEVEEEEVIGVIEGDVVLPGYQDPESYQAQYDDYSW